MATTAATVAVSAAGSQDDNGDAGCVAGWSQARVDAVFYALVGDLAGAPQEIIDPHTGRVEGRVIQSLYGQRAWVGGVSSPLLFAGQFVDAESGWAYNRFRFYSPVLAGFNAQDPLGLAPRVASAQGYVDHAAYWVDVLGLMSHIVANKAAGAKYETVAKSVIREKMGSANWAEQVTTRVGLGEAGWKNSRADFIVKGNDGLFHFIEVKSGNAKLTEGQQLVQNELAKTGGAVEMRSAVQTKLRPLGVETGDMLQGHFHTFYMDNASHVEQLSNLLNTIA